MTVGEVRSCSVSSGTWKARRTFETLSRPATKVKHQMRKRLIGVIALAAVLTVAAIALFVHLQQAPADAMHADATRRVGPSQESTRQAQPPGSGAATAQRLERDSRIPPGSYTAVGPKAYQITRAHEFRPAGDALAHVRQLMLRSDAGDATATYEIHLTIEQCQTFTSDRADVLADSAASVGAGGWFLERSERLLKECESLALERDIYHTDWLSKAAAMGSQEAMRAYSLSPEKVIGSLDDAIRDPARLSQWKETALNYLDALAAQGNISALGDLERAYAAGSFTQPDPVRAWAYARALQRVNPRLVTHDDLMRYEKDLTQEEKANSRTLAENIYQNCCILK